MTSNDDVLNSWKEVASYLGRGVRTVQRWEQELNLPVRRPRGRSRSAVIAFKTELDTWLHRNHANPPAAAVNGVPPARHSVSLDVAKTERNKLHERTTALVKKMEQLMLCSTSLCERSRVLSQRFSDIVGSATTNLSVTNMGKSSPKNGGEETKGEGLSNHLSPA
ncbi:MAG TPA: hypothetical protein VKH81_11210 [Candidatus Angelobacter sp.]|nr:hypothetical protein [Candidatus Angelobacter sp.]